MGYHRCAGDPGCWAPVSRRAWIEANRLIRKRALQSEPGTAAVQQPPWPCELLAPPQVRQRLGQLASSCWLRRRQEAA
jgi:hypothetical protein